MFVHYVSLEQIFAKGTNYKDLLLRTVYIYRYVEVQVQSIFNHSTRVLVKILGHHCSHKNQAHCTSYTLCLYVAHLCGRMVMRYFLRSGETRDTTVIKRGLLIDFQNHTLCRKYISKGTACMPSVICSAWFKHAKAMFKPQANTF